MDSSRFENGAKDRMLWGTAPEKDDSSVRGGIHGRADAHDPRHLPDLQPAAVRTQCMPLHVIDAD